MEHRLQPVEHCIVEHRLQPVERRVHPIANIASRLS